MHNARPAEIYNLGGSGSWLAWDDDTSVHCRTIITLRNVSTTDRQTEKAERERESYYAGQQSSGPSSVRECHQSTQYVAIRNKWTQGQFGWRQPRPPAVSPVATKCRTRLIDWGCRHIRPHPLRITVKCSFRWHLEVLERLVFLQLTGWYIYLFLHSAFGTI